MYRILYIPTGGVVKAYYSVIESGRRVTYFNVHEELNNNNIEYSCDGLISSNGLEEEFYEFNNSKFRTKRYASVFLNNLVNSWLAVPEQHLAYLNVGIRFSTVTINEFEIVRT